MESIVTAPPTQTTTYTVPKTRAGLHRFQRAWTKWSERPRTPLRPMMPPKTKAELHRFQCAWKKWSSRPRTLLLPMSASSSAGDGDALVLYNEKANALSNESTLHSGGNFGACDATMALSDNVFNGNHDNNSNKFSFSFSSKNQSGETKLSFPTGPPDIDRKKLVNQSLFGEQTSLFNSNDNFVGNTAPQCSRSERNNPCAGLSLALDSIMMSSGEYTSSFTTKDRYDRDFRGQHYLDKAVEVSPDNSREEEEETEINEYSDQFISDTSSSNQSDSSSNYRLSSRTENIESNSNSMFHFKKAGEESSIEEDYRDRLVRFYLQYNPSKLSSIDATLQRYQGKEDELFEKLKQRYCSDTSLLPPCGSGPTCFIDLSLGGKLAGRIKIKLFMDKTPLAAENFRQLCTGESGLISKHYNKLLHYRDCTFHRIIPDFVMQGGDFTNGDGTGGTSIYMGTEHGDMWGKFKDETPFMKHSKRGLLSMANNGKDRNGSQFFITLKPLPHLDGKHVVFGEVVEGMQVVDYIVANVQTDKSSKPLLDCSVVIEDCGEIRDGNVIGVKNFQSPIRKTKSL